jgi:hypothetical protein
MVDPPELPNHGVPEKGEREAVLCRTREFIRSAILAGDLIPCSRTARHTRYPICSHADHRRGAAQLPPTRLVSYAG